MKNYIKKHSHLGVGKIAFGEAEIFSLIDREKIEIIETSGKNSFYFTVEDVPFIAVPKKLKGIELYFHLLHELGHHFNDHGKTPNQAFFHGLSDSPEETKADVFALVALIPKRLIGSYEFLDNHPNKFARKIYNDRIRISFLYGV